MPTYLCWDDSEERPEQPAEHETTSHRWAAEDFAADTMGLYDDDFAVAVQERGSDEVQRYMVARVVEYRSRRLPASEPA